MSNGKMMFGMTANGPAIHVVVGDAKTGFHARCDKRRDIPGLLVNADVTNVSCSKCKRFADVKKAIADADNPERIAEIAATKADAKQKAAKAKAKPVAKKKAAKSKPDAANKVEKKPSKEKHAEPPAEAPDPVQHVIDRLNHLDGMLVKLSRQIDRQFESLATALNQEDGDEPKTKGGQLSEENYKDFLKEGTKPEEAETVTGRQFKSELSTSSQNPATYKIIHIPTGQIMFNGVDHKAMATVIKYLNNLKVRWENKNDTIPKDFIPACAAAFKAAYNSHGLTVNIKTDPKVKPPRVIKRRDTGSNQKKPRTITRRSTPSASSKNKNVNKYGIKEDSPRGLLCHLVEKGSHYHEIIKVMKADYKLNQKEATAKLRGIIRKLTKTGHPVMCIKASNKNDDFYHIVDKVH
jgi:hypothetical protein